MTYFVGISVHKRNRIECGDNVASVFVHRELASVRLTRRMTFKLLTLTVTGTDDNSCGSSQLLSPRRIICYQRRLGGEQAHRVHGPASSARVSMISEYNVLSSC